jgi:predicted NBD/HSP70 family sugar kinase
VKRELLSGTGLRVSSKAAREDTRVTNRRLVLQHLFDGSEHSRADLARLTGLTAATAGGIVGELEESGLIVEVGTRRQGSQVGKPPKMLSVRPDSRNVISVDLSDPTTFRGAVVDLGGTVIANVDVENPGLANLETLTPVGNIIELAIAKATAPILGIGIGTPGVVTATGSVVEASNFGWHHVDLGAHIDELTGHPTYVSNDANAAAIAEFSRGGHDCRNLAVVKIGSGVGAGYVLNGQPYEGERAGAGEIGHLVVAEDGPLCRCGHLGCLETFVAASALEIALGAPDANVTAVRHDAAQKLGVALAAIVAILGLDHIVIAGPRRLLGDKFCDSASESLRARCLESVAESVTVSYTSLGDDVVLLGAASLVLSQELGVA